MIEGRRVTDAATLRVVTMAYAGLINKDIVTALQVLSCNALGLTGADGKIVLSQKRKVENIDYGWVGDVTYVNTNQLIHFMESGLKPIIAPLTFDASVGTLLNTNADTMASAIATAFTKDYSVSLYYCFEKNGVLTDIDDENSYIPLITQAHYSELKQSGVVSAGMIPKLDNAFTAIHAGVEKVYLAPPDSIPLLIKGIKAPATLLIH
jgi:acetylglutamate kinase